MRVRPRPLGPLPDGRAHDTERSPGGIAVSEQACGKLCPAKDLRVGLPYYDGTIETRYNHCHICILPFLVVLLQMKCHTLSQFEQVLGIQMADFFPVDLADRGCFNELSHAIKRCIGI